MKLLKSNKNEDVTEMVLYATWSEQFFYRYSLLILGAIVNGAPPQQSKGPTEVLGNIGSSVSLPCNTTSSSTKPVILVMWFKGNNEDPFYSLDMRKMDKKSEEKGKHWAHQRWRNKATFKYIEDSSISGHLSRLILSPLSLSDEGLYRCRVDYKQAPTKIETIKLSILVPPSPPLIYDDHDIQLTSVVGPLHTGSNITLKCRARGGQPLPILAWSRDRITLNSSSQVLSHTSSTSSSSVQSTVSTLHITNLTRQDDGSVYHCLAHSQALHKPLSEEVTLDVILPPLSVLIHSPRTSLTAGLSYNFSCSSKGSSPFVVFNWTRVFKTDEEFEKKYLGNTSVISLVASVLDHNSTLVCEAFNPLLRNQRVQDQMTVNIHYKPKISLSLGSSIEMNNIKEGEDIYLECLVDSRPEVQKLHYTHKGNKLDLNKPGRKLVSKGILVIQNISRHDAGDYVCVAENEEGIGSSQVIEIHVLYAPICKTPPQLYGLSVGDQIDIPCSVSANPEDLTFHWFFNTTQDSKEFINLPGSHNENNSSMTVSYRARSVEDYGTLLCFASNSVGHQDTPCASHIIPSGPPDPVQDCSTGEPDPFIVSILCNPGYDGGLTQTFTAEFYTSTDYTTLQSTVTNNHPTFTVYNLPPGTRYYVKIYAENAKGRSTVKKLKASTVKETSRLPLLPPEQSFYDTPGVPYLSKPNSPGRLEQTVFIVLASVAGLAFIVIITLLLCKFQCQVGGHSISRGVPTATSSTSPLSARELVEISLLQETDAEGDVTADTVLLSMPASGSLLSNSPLIGSNQTLTDAGRNIKQAQAQYFNQAC